MPGFCSQTAYIFAGPNVAQRGQCCLIPTPLAAGASLLTPCVGAAAVYAHSVTSPGSRLSRLSRVSPLNRTSQIRRIARMPLGTRRTRSQRSMLIKWIARVSLSSRKTRVQRSSRHPRTPRTPRRETPVRRPMICKVGGSRHRLEPPRRHLSVFHQPATFSPPPTNAPASHLLSRLHDLAHMHRPP